MTFDDIFPGFEKAVHKEKREETDLEKIARLAEEMRRVGDKKEKR